MALITAMPANSYDGAMPRMTSWQAWVNAVTTQLNSNWLNYAQLMYKIAGANMNITTDQAFTFMLNAACSSWLYVAGFAVNASVSLTTAAGGIYSGAGKTGNIIVAAAQAYTNADASGSDGQALTFAKGGAGIQVAAPILNLTTGQGVAATADIYLFGVPLT